ncbi:acyltransferase family protein [Polynucleobacter sp. AP-Latsch-80-C2]|jgi:peptidoglycan/LPS O-acetylase OafA/YrhL|uniref:acyltransferase family protein n=1 Tax=Polynucleobacter sp. AP-Latsch-80-C2 TaxID=2576931 RepID=UPI001C0B25F1|nr:acyltransferase family protein [Polynucleobacter sp. AP-Latsch-80-C2]MBU3624383.1 acyltransferase [Polynucleobacter sp. AP-Latsch-80-C2]
MKALLPPHYRPDIDGLRAIAVLSVVLFHAFPNGLPGGFIGVDIFFVISGYLISSIIFRKIESGTFSFLDFYGHRIRRIFPSLFLVLVCALIFGWFALLADEYRQLGIHTAASGFFVENLLLWSESGYFDNSSETKILLHLWSLGIEEQFYIIWPVLLWVSYKAKWNFLAITVLIGACSFALNIFQANIAFNSVADFYSPQTRFWELLMGACLAYLGLNESKKISLLTKNIISIAGLLLIAAGFFVINKKINFPGWWALIPTIGAVLIIASGSKAIINKLILSNRLLVWIGLISYPLYLWHWPLLSFARIMEGGTPPHFVRALIVLTSFLLAYLSYRFVEIPIRFGKYQQQKALALILLLLIISSMGLYTGIRNGFEDRASISSAKAINSQFVGSMWKYSTNDACQKQYPFAPAKNYAWWFCVANTDKPPTLLVLGSSYANQLYPGIVENQRLKHHSVLSIGACSAQWLEPPPSKKGDESPHPCGAIKAYEQQVFINQIIQNEKSLRYIIIGGLNDESANEESYAALKKRIDFLEANNTRVILFAPHIYHSYDIKSCFSRPLIKTKNDCNFPYSEYIERTSQFNQLISKINITNPKVLGFNQNDLFCKDQSCSFIINGMPAFRDEDHHLSEYASKLLFEAYFIPWAKNNLPEMLNIP